MKKGRSKSKAEAVELATISLLLAALAKGKKRNNPYVCWYSNHSTKPTRVYAHKFSKQTASKEDCLINCLSE